MKKLFASLLAATMVAGMAVSAFAQGPKLDTGYITGGDDYTLETKVYNYKDGKLEDRKDNEQVNGGKKLYYPILVSESELKDNGVATDYYYATKASEVEDLKAKVKAVVNGKYIEKEAKIVRKNKDFTASGASTTTEEKIYCVEVKTADFFETEESEIEFDVTLYNKGRKQATTEDQDHPRTDFTLGKDAFAIDLNDGTEIKDNTSTDSTAKTTIGAALKANAEKNAVRGLYKVKFNKNELSMKVLPDADAVVLENATKDNGDEEDIEIIDLDFTKANASFEVAASSQDDLFLGYSTDADKAIVVANQDADIDFLDFDANPTFDFTGTLKLTVEDPDVTYFCYEIKDGKLTPAGKYNADDECFEIRTRTLGSYALSDKELVNAKADEEKPADKPAEEKPATGNDKVVGTGAIA